MKQFIIEEIKRLADDNAGHPPGQNAFASATGIIPNKWLGKYWARWSDALIEAGFSPNQWQSKSDKDTLIAGLIAACRHFG